MVAVPAMVLSPLRVRADGAVGALLGIARNAIEREHQHLCGQSATDAEARHGTGFVVVVGDAHVQRAASHHLAHEIRSGLQLGHCARCPR